MDPTHPPKSSSSVRVLIRPPVPAPAPAPTSSSPFPPPLISSSTPPSRQTPSSSTSQPRLDEGIVVVGFIGRKSDDVSQLINRIVDSNIFGSANIDKDLYIGKEGLGENVKNWFKYRMISYYYEEEKRTLFLQFCSIRCPAMEEEARGILALDSVVEEREFEDRQGMLFMFSVCHVIIYIQEGSCLDTEVLKKFRVLQTAKNVLAPFLRSQNNAPSASSLQSSSSSQPSRSLPAANNFSPGRSRGMLSGNAAISLMSGLSSYTSLFPGQCTPVTLFVFLDDFSDVQTPDVEEITDTSSLKQSFSLSSSGKSKLPIKGSGSVVVLARPGGNASKSEGGFRKKLQSSLEAQIRFLVKKCKILSGSENSHAGLRGGGTSSSTPLFSLDASRAVVLLDKCANQRGESLEFVSSLVEDVLSGKANLDSLMLESHSQSANKEDILAVREFIYRQSDIVRGRGGPATSTSGGSAAGVGMVAIAAAAAAASAASGKVFTAPELPLLEVWLSSACLILDGLLSAKHNPIDDNEIGRRKPRQRAPLPPRVEGQGIASKGINPLEIAVSWLDRGRGMDMKFSALWCQKAIPAAKEVYLKDLPACYATSQHEAHLEKALGAFRSMVKGPTLELFAKKLEDECTSVWRSGRQLCDAISLTGKPCMHRRHDAESSDSLLGDGVKPHSSGYFFLHACACGRSRKLRPDPFDFETANVAFNSFSDCDKLFPALQLPKIGTVGPVEPSAWNLIRIGSARYYDPSKGLLQSGFCTTQRFLLKWTIFLEEKRELIDSSVPNDSVTKSRKALEVECIGNLETEKALGAQTHQGKLHNGVGHQVTVSQNIRPAIKKISFGSGLPNFAMRKPFSEVVAGSMTVDSAFPPLQQKKQSLSGSREGQKHNGLRINTLSNFHPTTGYKGSEKLKDAIHVWEASDSSSINGYTEGDPFLQIGSNVIPVSTNGSGRNRFIPPLKHAMVYVGFEHECPHGHRFILNADLLNVLGSLYSCEESHVPLSVETVDQNLGNLSKLTKKGGRVKDHRHSTSIAVNRVWDLEKSSKSVIKDCQQLRSEIAFCEQGKQQKASGLSTPLYVKGTEERLHSVGVDDGGFSFSLLNRNLPIFMNCPHCKTAKLKDLPEIKFSGTISQLQRIFLVTPPFPVTLASCPVIQFEATCLPSDVPDREKKLQFSIGCQVILPPDSFLTLRLPFVYGVQLEDKNLHPLLPFEDQPELTAWIAKGTTLQVMLNGRNLDG